MINCLSPNLPISRSLALVYFFLLEIVIDSLCVCVIIDGQLIVQPRHYSKMAPTHLYIQHSNHVYLHTFPIIKWSK